MVSFAHIASTGQPFFKILSTNPCQPQAAALELHSTIGFQNEQTHALLLNISAACGWQGLVERILKKGCPVDAILLILESDG
jgi:hypothetical protein